MHMSPQHHSSNLEIPALAPAAHAGKECARGEAVGYIIDYNPKWSHLAFFLPFKTNNKQIWSFTIESLFLRQLPHLSGINP